MHPNWSITLLVSLLTGCASNLYYQSPHPPPALDLAPAAYVENPELVSELEILKRSGLFRISADPSVGKRIELTEIESLPGCGMGVMLTPLSFGLLPGRVPRMHAYRFVEKDGPIVREHSYMLEVMQKYSLYEFFKFWRPSSEKVLAAVLADEARNVRPE